MKTHILFIVVLPFIVCSSFLYANEFRLPFPDEEKLIVTQGNNSSYTHKGKLSFAYDFSGLPYTKIDDHVAPSGVVLAMKTGTVIKINNGVTGYTNCPWAGNFIVISHNDGTVALYAHLAPNSIRVADNEEVLRGDWIADIGSTGVSTGAHLHVQVMNKNDFDTAKGSKECPQNDGINAPSKAFSFSDPNIIKRTSDGRPQENQSYISDNFNLYVSCFSDGTIRKVDTEINPQTGFARTRVFASGLTLPEDIVVGLLDSKTESSRGILYVGGVFNGVKRIRTLDGKRLPDVGVNICGPEGPSIDVNGDVFFNTRLSPCVHSGIWKITKGTSENAVQVTPPFSNWGEGTAFSKAGPFKRHLLASSATESRIVRSSPSEVSTNRYPHEFITNLCVPVGIALNSQGDVFISDACSGQIFQYDPNGVFKSVSNIIELAQALFIEFDETDNLYIADSDGDIIKMDRLGNVIKLAIFHNSTPVGIAVGR